MTPQDYLHSLFDLSGTTSVVIGGTGVLGGRLARSLALAGSRVIICGRGEEAGNETAAAIAEAGGTAEVFTLDATVRGDLQDLADELASRDQPCDVLINAAGINSATPFLEIPDDEWDKILRVNLTAVRLGCEIFGRMMTAAGGGSIINMASMSAITPLSRVFTYSVSKAGVLNLTRNLAREWGETGVRVNAISPGFFPAEQNRDVLTPDRISSIMTHTPMRRFGKPTELDAAVLLLASPRAGSFITGENLVVDGGFSAMTI